MCSFIDDVYENRNTLMYKVIGAVIYTINDEYICSEYMGLLQENLSKTNDYKNKIKDFLDWEYLIF